MITFAQARRIVENDVPGGAETATVGYESDGRWWPIVLPARLGGRVPGVSKDSGVLTWVSSLDPEYAASRPWGRLDARPNPYTHLPGQHDQSSHGRKGIRKPDTDVTPRTRARRQSAERERRDIEAHARREAQQAVDMHAARALAELAIEFEELAAKGASPRAMTHRVRARMRRLGLEPSVEQAGQQVTFDPDRHEVIGVRPAPGEQVLVVRPGYVWARPGGGSLIERPTVIGAAPSSVTSLLTHLPGLHDQKDHGRRYGPGDVRPTRTKAKKPATPKKNRSTRRAPDPPPLTPQQEAMRARREPTPVLTAEAVRKIYGARLREDGSVLAAAAVAGLAEVPEPIHRIVQRHMDSWFPAAGIYFTQGEIIDFVPETVPFANQQPRGYPQGATFRDSTGLYSPSERFMAAGTNRSRGGRSEAEFADTAQHELGHALDHALGRPSATHIAWNNHLLALGDSSQINVRPYYTPAGNPDGWRAEGFAQAMRGWAEGLPQRREGNRVYTMLSAFGYVQRDFTKLPYEQDFDQGLVEAAQYMIGFFDRVAAGVS